MYNKRESIYKLINFCSNKIMKIIIKLIQYIIVKNHLLKIKIKSKYNRYRVINLLVKKKN